MHPLLQKYAQGGPVEESQGDEPMDSNLEDIASECIDAIHSKDAGRLVECLSAMFHALEAQPHEEAPSPSEEDYE